MQKSKGIKQLRQKVRDQQAMIEELVWAIAAESADTGEGIHAYTWGAFRAALDMTGIEYSVPSAMGEDYTNGVKFLDLDWVQRQRDRWQQRQAE